MIVVIAGMQRSGSTFSFNVARSFLEHGGTVVHAVTDELDEARELAENSDHVVIKTHQPGSEMNNAIVTRQIRCICTYRKPEDAAMSWSRAFGFPLEESVLTIKSWLAWHTAFRSYLVDLPYSTIDRWPLLAVRRIGRALAPEVRPGAAGLWKVYRANRKKRVREQVKRVERGEAETTRTANSYYDSETLYHRSHISERGANRAQEKLGPEQLRAVRRQLAPYVDRRGNYG